MMSIFDWLFKDHEKLKAEIYLSTSHDLVELERRQKQISRGEAPWQRTGMIKAKGWL
jgi:hypothetical protein